MITLSNTIINDSFENQRAAQIILHVLAYINNRWNSHLRPDESLAYFGDQRVSLQARYLRGDQVIDRLANLFALSWTLTEDGTLNFAKVPPLAS
jgi:hypothetical protein